MAAMIDWVTARVPWPDDVLINGGAFVSIDVDGVIERTTLRRLEVEGSHSSKVMVRAGGGSLDFSGNPSKFLQGQNLFGPASLVPLMAAALELVAGRLGVTPADSHRQDWRRGHYTVSRVDVTRMIDCGSPARVRKVLDVLGQVARTKYQARSVVGSGTVYIGQHSRRVALKFYDKHAELETRGHGLCATLAPDWHQKLLGFAAGKLRCELTMRSNELRDQGLWRAALWTAELAESALDARLAVLEVNETMRLAEDVVADLPPKLVPIYHAWRAGADFRVLYSKAQFYRYRHQMLAYGIDIAHVQPHEVVPETLTLSGMNLRELLCSPGVEPPAWARGTSLLACSAA